MNALANYLKAERLKSGLSQQDVAERSRSLSQKQISRIELDPLTQDLSTVMEYLNIVAGGKTDEFLQIISKINTNESTLKMQNTGMNMKSKQLLAQQIEAILQKLGTTSNTLLNESNILNKIKKIRENLRNIQTKPIIAAMGPSDAGKSTLLNFILKDNLLPAKWQPTTCLVTLLMHKSDKPVFINGNVSIYKVGFQPYMIFDEDEQKKYYIESGDSSLLKKYASKNENGGMYDESAYMVITFVDAPILSDVWLLDTPGQLIDHDAIRRQLNGEITHDLLSDEAKAISAVRLANGIIFASSTTKFLRDNEPSFFSSILKSNPPLDGKKPLENIVILKTHSYGEIDKEANEQIFFESSIHLNKEFGYLLYDSWQFDCPNLVIPSAKDWQEIMLPFFKENSEYCQAFDLRLLNLINHLITKRNKYVEHQLLQVKNEIRKLIEAEKNSIQSKQIDAETRTLEVDLKVARFRKEEQQLVDYFEILLKSCDQRKDYDIETLSDIFNGLANNDSMFEFIEKKFDDKDHAKLKIADAVSAYLENKAKIVLTNSTKLFATELDLIVEKWQRAIPSSNSNTGHLSNTLDELELNTVYSDFDARSAFVGGLTGLASFGAMAGYVATITSNLGAYILVGKAAGILTALGITGSVTTLPVIVAQTGGPTVWGITIAAAIGLLVYKLFSDWKTSMAKSVVSGLREGGALKAIKVSVGKYWDDSKIALNKSIDSLKKETEIHIESIKYEAKAEYSCDEINEALEEIELISKLVY
ncbi:MAG: dynamin family protein [Burkholderiaceae bacterium]